MPLALRLTLIDLFRLAIDGEILVDDADPPFLGKGDGHVALGHGIHGGAEQGDIEANPPRELGRDVNIRRQDLTVAGFQENVVEGQTEVVGNLVAHRRPILVLSSPRPRPFGRGAGGEGSSGASFDGIGHYVAGGGKRKGPAGGS